MEMIFKNSWLAYKNLIYIIKQEGLFQNKVNSSLVFTWNCKMGYWQHFTCFSRKQTSCLLTAVCSESLVLLLPMMASLWNSKKGSSKNMLVSMTRIFVSRIIQQHWMSLRWIIVLVYIHEVISAELERNSLKKTISLIDGWIRAWTLYSLWKRWHQWLKRKRRKFQLLFLLRRNVELYLLPSTHREWVTSFCRFLPIT